ncbi:hypothetical protein QUB80_24695 [Chlorogloeopsis sp. ULAP01]|uniref:hypothetical protein n=1 Tax=Chlorogloeopsis sp. ULAP01 TaxID=3056483 RepID=UPI0025AB28CB|nr:hypothetical protein [Chlorogloeopsis sp. ULAP01]MDM9383888.1 hypothetical protein [Chlorogloeopsis sp. ULAP01]
MIYQDLEKDYTEIFRIINSYAAQAIDEVATERLLVRGDRSVPLTIEAIAL